MAGNTKRISHTNLMDWLRRTQRCERSWCAGTFRSMEVCWHGMVLSRDSLPMKTVANTGDTGEGGLVAATLSISAAALPQRRYSKRKRRLLRKGGQICPQISQLPVASILKTIILYTWSMMAAEKGRTSCPTFDILKLELCALNRLCMRRMHKQIRIWIHLLR